MYVLTYPDIGTCYQALARISACVHLDYIDIISKSSARTADLSNPSSKVLASYIRTSGRLYGALHSMLPTIAVNGLQ